MPRLILFFLTLFSCSLAFAQPLKFSSTKLVVEDPGAPSRVVFGVDPSSGQEVKSVPVQDVANPVPVKVQAVTVEEPEITQVSLSGVRSNGLSAASPKVLPESPKAVQVLVAPVQEPRDEPSGQPFGLPMGFGLTRSGSATVDPYNPPPPSRDMGPHENKAAAEKGSAAETQEATQDPLPPVSLRVEKAIPLDISRTLSQASARPAAGGYTDLETGALLNVAGRAGGTVSPFAPPVVGSVW